jgi:hypothetical protein
MRKYDTTDTQKFLSEFANDYLYDFPKRDLSYEELHDLMEEHAMEEEADDMFLPDYKM